MSITDEQRQKIKNLMDKPLDLIIADGFEATAESIRRAYAINGQDVVGPNTLDGLFQIIKNNVAPFAVARFLLQGYLEEMGMTLDEAIDEANSDMGIAARLSSINDNTLTSRLNTIFTTALVSSRKPEKFNE